MTSPSEIASSAPRIHASIARPPPIAERIRGIVMNGPIPTMSIMFSAMPRQRPISRFSSVIARRPTPYRDFEGEIRFTKIRIAPGTPSGSSRNHDSAV